MWWYLTFSLCVSCVVVTERLMERAGWGRLHGAVSWAVIGQTVPYTLHRVRAMVRDIVRDNVHTHIHTHPFNVPLSRTTQVSRYQKGKTNLDFTEARDNEWQWRQLGYVQVCTSLQTKTMPAPHHSVFYRPGALPASKPTASKHWRHGIS